MSGDSEWLSVNGFNAYIFSFLKEESHITQMKLKWYHYCLPWGNMKG